MRRRQPLKSNKLKKWLAAPYAVWAAGFIIIPLILILYYAFTGEEGGFTLSNFAYVATKENIKALGLALWLSLLSTALCLLLAYPLAMILANRNVNQTSFIVLIFILPMWMNFLLRTYSWMSILENNGLLNQFFRALGLDFMAKNWLTDTKLALLSVCGVEIWKWSGFHMVIILAGLQAVPPEYQEAATIDGANAWQRFWRVTFPLILPAFNNAFVNSLIGGLKVFDIIVATTNGGPGVTTQVMNTMIYRSFSFNMQGEANAGYVLLAVIVALFAVSSYSIIRKREVDL